jgi:hypothetical protein
LIIKNYNKKETILKKGFLFIMLIFAGTSLIGFSEIAFKKVLIKKSNLSQIT